MFNFSYFSFYITVSFNAKKLAFAQSSFEATQKVQSPYDDWQEEKSNKDFWYH